MHKATHTLKAVHKNFPQYAHPLTDRSKPQIEPICIFKKRPRFRASPSATETHTRSDMCLFCRGGIKKVKSLNQQITPMQRKYNPQAPTVEIRLWMTIPLCSTPLALPRFSINDVIIRDTNRSSVAYEQCLINYSFPLLCSGCHSFLMLLQVGSTAGQMDEGVTHGEQRVREHACACACLRGPRNVSMAGLPIKSS